MKNIIGIIIGLIFLVAPIYVWIIDYASFGTAALIFLKGGAIWLALLIGAVSLLIGISGLKD